VTAVSIRGGTLADAEVRLLGPVEVDTGSATVPLGGPRLRTLVGLLALRAPDVVSRQTLIEGIWDGTPPANAAKTLRAHIAYLRRGLDAGGIGALVATRAPGYLLGAPPECVDVHRFEGLVGRGRAASAAGAGEAAVDHLRTALGLWRGEVLAGCAAGEWVRAEATRLHEVRLAATEELLAVELTLGRQARVVAELESLVVRHPLRERLWELLMRALYRAGRQGDALQAYRRARTRLVSEIGVEPGPELQRLEAVILAGTPEPPLPSVSAAAWPGSPSGVEVTAVVLPRQRENPPAQPTPPAQPGAEQPPSPVPTPLTNLVGRLAEIVDLCGLLQDRRLVTLTGVGGCGKTRLAVAVAEEMAGRYPDGLRFVDLTPVSDPELVAATVAAALGVTEDPSAGHIAALTRHLRPRNCLLVLDNCEHVVRSCAQLVTALLGSCPRLRVLATSRETLGVLGEVIWPVPPLTVPPPESAGSGLAHLRRYESVRLFLERATLATTRGLTDADAPALAAVCTRLDGLPLAIELAAARTAVLTVAELADRLTEPAVLYADRQTARPHHRALDSTIAWSYELLDPATRSRFRRLAVFAGGFTLAAAEAVWPDRGRQAGVDLLADLVAKSLVVMERVADQARYRLLETIGRWAAARLAEVPEEERDARGRHAAHYLTLAEDADSRLGRPDKGRRLELLAAEHENLRAALAWYADGDPDPVAELRLAVAMAGYCRLRGRYSEGRRWLERALDGDTDAAPVGLVGQALAATAMFAFLVCDYGQATDRARQALLLQRQAGDQAGTVATLRVLASVARERGEYRRSLAELEEAMAALDSDCAAIADVLHLTGFTCWLAGDLDRAERALHGALRRYQQLGDDGNVAASRTCLAAVALYRGQVDRAGWLASEGLVRFTELDFKEGIGWALNIIGLVALRQGRCGTALATLRASLEAHCAVDDRWRQTSVLEALAAVFLAMGEPTRAAELVGLATALRDTLGVPVPAQERPDWDRTHAVLRRLLPENERHAAFARGAALRVPDVVAGLERTPT
jgi:predicted ATPase/DNA-binding SARP family transcriptional activator